MSPMEMSNTPTRAMARVTRGERCFMPLSVSPSQRPAYTKCGIFRHLSRRLFACHTKSHRMPLSVDGIRNPQEDSDWFQCERGAPNSFAISRIEQCAPHLF